MGSREKVRPTPPPRGPALVRPTVGVLLLALGGVADVGCKAPHLPPMPPPPMPDPTYGDEAPMPEPEDGDEAPMPPPDGGDEEATEPGPRPPMPAPMPPPR
jgi:hypothetical protein